VSDRRVVTMDIDFLDAARHTRGQLHACRWVAEVVEDFRNDEATMIGDDRQS